ncbi:MAG: aromatic ring-hydroxylating dioxygenase subunit alpha [Spirochaetes bacterium]|nr:aromatic ring-hydroxylating dioxygenase subunit alpha [Spirochaetota bacterium]MBU1081038.1 aromatic ring-hydroxylating dioxygenase subunit alpha [Spirochaetota bacterium]
MIRDLWYAVLESKEIPRNRPVGFTRLGERMIFWRDAEGKASCFFDRCAHRGASLALGDIVDGHARCPFHGLEYDSSGRCVKIPANGKNAPVPPAFKMRSYPVFEGWGWVFIWWGDGEPDPAEPPYFEDLKGLSYWGSVQDPWDNHYTRVAENQLDVAHLPFVHHNTIGRGNWTLVEGPGVQWVSDRLFFQYVYNKVDDGSAPRGPDEVPAPDPDRDYKIEFLLPNLWENRISDKLRVTAAFAPVDEERTILYLRFYPVFMPVPGLRWVVSRLGGLMNLVIARQDRRIVNTQLPKTDGTGTGESLFRGDKPIMEFRKKRRELRKRGS